MAEGYICDVCGKQLKNAAGLAGHKMLVHPVTRDQANDSLPGEALAEMPGDVKSSFERSEDLKSQFQEVQAQLRTINGRLDDFSRSIVERLQVSEKAKLEEESAAQAAQQELDKWQKGQLHHRLRSHWNHAENCEDCAQDKAVIVAELAAQSNPEALEAVQEADGSASEQATQTVTDTGLNINGGSLLDTNGEATRVKRFRVAKEAFLAFLFEGYQPLPDGVEEPREGDETEDEFLADHWRRAGYRIEGLGKSSDDAPTKPIMYEPGWLARIYGERD